MTTLLTNPDAVLEGLSDAQRAAASYIDGPLIIVAGPGSGKTRVMAHRMAYILATGVRPWRALGVTFTNKAAAELRQRCDALANRFVPDASETNVSTFHSFGARFLRTHHDAAGLGRDFTIYDRDDQERTLKQLIGDMKVDASIGEVLADISRAKNNNQTPETFASISTDPGHEDNADIYAQYEAYLGRANAVDFDDLLLKPYQILVRDEHIRSAMQNRYQHIMVDEFQDTNALQFELVRVLGDAHRRICVVGDPDQSIYSWRNARPENIEMFAEALPECEVFELGESYRSTKTIIAAAAGLISHNDRKIERSLFTNNEEGDLVEIDATQDPEHEASVILNAVERATRSKTAKDGNRGRLNDVAVLYRTNAQSRAIETECSRRGVPYRLYGGVRFYERREIKDALALLRIVVNPLDETSLRRIINVPPRGIGPATLRKVEQYSVFNSTTLLDSVLSSCDLSTSHELGLGRAALNKVRSFAEFVQALFANAETVYPHDLLRFALKASGYDDWIRKDVSTYFDRRENLTELSSLTSKYSDLVEGLHPRQALSDFLEHTALFTNVDAMDNGIGVDGTKGVNPSNIPGALTLITLHQAKGLEFDTVFISGLCEGVLPHYMVNSADSEELQEAAMREERRLMYVGMTRAKRKLHITWPKFYREWGYGEQMNPSRFLAEIPMEYVKNTMSGRAAPPP
ncbi:MAG: AAA family ATPase, partial [Chloroflexi bacterium]|nr:AAA family ATPase [Chloroflexota bacterium]